MPSGDGSTMPKNAARNQALAERNADIFNLFHFGDDEGNRYRQIDLAERFNLTPGSISQIVNNPQSHRF